MSAPADPVKLSALHRGEQVYVGQGKSGRTRLKAFVAELEPGTYDISRTTGRIYVKLRKRPPGEPQGGPTTAAFFKKGLRS